MFELLFIGFVLFGMAFTVMLVASFFGSSRTMKRKDELLGEMFSGDPPTVSWRETISGLPADVVIAEAHQRGYAVIADSGHGKNRSREVTFGRQVS